MSSDRHSRYLLSEHNMKTTGCLLNCMLDLSFSVPHTLPVYQSWLVRAGNVGIMHMQCR